MKLIKVWADWRAPCHKQERRLKMSTRHSSARPYHVAKLLRANVEAPEPKLENPGKSLW